jgi:hypothetical protein
MEYLISLPNVDPSPALPQVIWHKNEQALFDKLLKDRRIPLTLLLRQ